jgi:NTE family protein
MGARQMLDEMAKISTERLFNDRPPRGDEPMRIKSDAWRPLASPEFGLNDGDLTTPKGVVGGVALEAELRHLVKVRDARPFDQLPIPFRAVATSLGDGQMVVFDRGLLSTAMRASMAVPALVAPLKVGDRLLIDGGLVRNLPVDVARDMGADVVIAVNLGTPLLKPEQIQGLTGVSMQTLGILTEQNVRESLQQLRPQDVLIEPALGDFSAADFDNLLQTVPIGEAAARAAAPRLRALALPAQDYAALRRSQQSDVDAPPQFIASIDVAGNQRVAERGAGQPLVPAVTAGPALLRRTAAALQQHAAGHLHRQRAGDAVPREYLRRRHRLRYRLPAIRAGAGRPVSRQEPLRARNRAGGPAAG